MQKKANYPGLRYGIDVDYLYDFYNTSKDSIGLSFGFGYELANYVARTTTIDNRTTSVTYKTHFLEMVLISI
ncbi:outer membrane beta-barrel protein [Helicobacter sp. 13S00482-2]|uniref:outer membrane beta-barrel protein n=1 Tax=Helicobacter sp. 13S00482-2 TaxID=1476200 RepID=UPI000BA621FC|nr:outer membrane beta-barrel protein [Helicobacter sp. 13S00482-2]